jgi:hypothetical protein
MLYCCADKLKDNLVTGTHRFSIGSDIFHIFKELYQQMMNHLYEIKTYNIACQYYVYYLEGMIDGIN